MIENNINNDIKKNSSTRIIGITLILLIIIFVSYLTYIKFFNQSSNLIKISEKFNGLSQIVELNKNGDYLLSSRVKGKQFIVTLKSANEDKEYIYNLDQNILSVSGYSDDINLYLVTSYVVDCVAQLNGVEANKVYSTLNSEEVRNYKIENGIEFIENNQSTSIKIDITKSIKLIDFSSKYIKPSDLESMAEFIKESGSAQSTIGDMVYHKSNDFFEDKIIILVGEPYIISDRTYNSILSFIEFIYDKNEVTNFKTQLSKTENKTFGKYQVILNPELSDFEKVIFDNTDLKITKLIINDKQKDIFDEDSEKPIGNIIGNNEYSKYNGNSISYSLVKELLLKNPNNTGSMSSQKYNNDVTIDLVVYKDMNKASSWLTDPETTINNAINKYLNPNKTYKVKITEIDNEIAIVIESN